MNDSGRAVFLSYASQDAEAARRICEALRSAGVEVWFDVSELAGGDQWDAKIRGQIGSCALFMPIISANTQARLEGYFRLEWKLAAQRTHTMADEKTFLLPIVVDGTRDAEAKVPAEFRTVQWTRLPNEAAPEKFCERVKKLLSQEVAQASSPAGSRDAGGTAALPQRVGRRVPAAAWIAGLVAVAGVIAFFAPRKPAPAAASALNVSSGTTTPEKSTTPLTEAQKLVAQARQVFEESDEMNRENLFLAEDLVKRALALELAEPAAWELGAWLSYFMVWHQIDASDARRDTMQRRAARALALAPRSVSAQLVSLNVRISGGWGASPVVPQRDFPEIERELVALAAGNPANWQVQRALGMTYRFLNRPDESIAALRRAVELSGGETSANSDLANVLERRKRLDESETVIAAGLARKRTGRLLAQDVFTKSRWRADLAGARTALESWPGWLLQEDRGLFLAWQTYFWSRQPEKALTPPLRVPRDYLRDAFFAGPRAVLTARAHEMAGHAEAAAADWRAVVQSADRELAQTPDDPSAQYWQAWALARLGETDRARALCTILLQRTENAPAFFFKGTNLAPLLVTAGMTEAALADVRTQLTTFNDSNTLTRAVLELDPAFDSIRNDPRFRQLVESAPAPAVGAVAAAMVSTPDPKSVVVLPFANLSGDPAQEYFSDGLTEEILSALTRERDLRVVPRASAFSFKAKNLPLPEIARALNVAQIVEGSVQRAGNRVRIRCTLTRVADGFAVPLPAFDRELKDGTDIFALEDEVARAVVEKLTQRTTTTAPIAVLTKDSDAYDAYLRGRELMNQTSPFWPKAVEAFRRAVELDPQFALAWANLGQLSASLYAYGFDGAALAASERAIAEAVRLQPDLPEAYLARAFYLRTSNATPEAVERELAVAERMRPDAPEIVEFRASVEFARGDEEPGLKLMQRVVDLDPRNGARLNTLGNELTSAGRYAEAEAIYRRSFQILSSSVPLTNRARLYVHWKADRALAIRTLDEAPEGIRVDRYWTSRALLLYYTGDQPGALAAAAHMKPRSEFFRIRAFFTAKMREAMGDVAGAQQDYLTALPLAEQQRDEFSALPEPYAILGLVYAGLGRKDEALAAVRKAIEGDQPGAIAASTTGHPGLARKGISALTSVDLELEPLVAFAQVQARFGMMDDALALVQAATAAGRLRRNYLLLSPDWAILRKDPRFRAIAETAPL